MNCGCGLVYFAVVKAERKGRAARMGILVTRTGKEGNGRKLVLMSCGEGI